MTSNATTHALRAAAAQVFDRCTRLIDAVTDDAFVASSATIRGGTIGAHVRHVLDHYAALFNGVESPPIAYDRRERRLAMERDRAAARAAVESLRARLCCPTLGADSPVTIRVMTSGEGDEVELRSTFGRELAFATHHAIHHLAMMRAIAAEFGVILEDTFGKAPSTVHHEHRTTTPA
ncbi:MAG: hypothetical protein DYG92_07150 [Leptolyngbya sp. PLA1]|nr:hypothetical protein [Leptolyngbya sp. PLA1]